MVDPVKHGFDPAFDPRPFEPEVVKRQKPVIVPREEWGALPPKSQVPTKLPLRRVFFTLWTDCAPCTTPDECRRTMRELQRRHMDEFGLSDIKYNFLIGGDEHIYEGRGWFTKSSKVLEMNPHHYLDRLDIAFIGDYRDNLDDVNEDGFMPNCELIIKEPPQVDTDDENVQVDKDGKFYEFEPLSGSEGEEVEPLHFVSREEWGALPPLDPAPNDKLPIKHVVYSMSTRRDTCWTKEECMGVMRRLQKRQMDEGMSDIAYNFMIGRDGTVYEGRGWQVKSAKKLKFNPALYGRRIDIGFIGDFHGELIPPVNLLEGAWNIQRKGIEESYLIDKHQVVYIRTELRRIRQGRASEFPTVEEVLDERKYPPDEFELPPIWKSKKPWKGI